MFIVFRFSFFVCRLSFTPYPDNYRQGGLSFCLLFTVYCLLFSVSIPYSYLSASTGFLVAALHVCRLTVNMAIPSAMSPAKTNTHQLRSVL